MAVFDSIAERVEQIAASVTKRAGIEFVHCQIAGSNRNPTVRLVIDKPGGVTLDDCADISREVEAVLDREDLIPTSYVLEVSSPGIDRELFKLSDFERFAGSEAKIRTGRPINGQKNFSGTIVGVDGPEIEFEDKSNGPVRISFDDVVKANLTVDLTADFRKG